MKYEGAFTPGTIQQVHEIQIQARTHRVEMASLTEGRVIEGRQLRLQHSINLHQGTCTCHVYQDIGIPCQHALACILYIHRNVYEYIPDDLSINTWRATYSTNMHPVVWQGIIPQMGNPEAEIQAPLTCIPRGRPRKERY